MEVHNDSTIEEAIFYDSFNVTSAMELYNSSIDTNSSTDNPDLIFRKKLKTTSDILTIVILIMVMFAMGADINWQQVWAHLRKPIGVCIGMLSQFVVMPLFGFSLVQAFRLDSANALSVLLVSCCPGGAVSNIFCYFLDGDVPLCITMTSMSGVLALGFMPANLWLYGHAVDTVDLEIPYLTMVISLVKISSPVCVGMLVRWKFPNSTRFITKPLSIVASLLIVVAITLQVIPYTKTFQKVKWNLIVIVLAMPTLGMLFGYCLAWVMKRTEEVRKTIAIESGVQNVAVALGVLALTPFEFEVQGQLIVFPLLYGVSMILFCFLGCIAFQVYKRCSTKMKNCEDVLQNKDICLSTQGTLKTVGGCEK